MGMTKEEARKFKVELKSSANDAIQTIKYNLKFDLSMIDEFVHSVEPRRRKRRK